MSSTQQNKMAIRFRPSSKEEFSLRCKNLSRLINEKHQRTMEILSRIYGYANLHELQQNLKKPGQVPGPYDDDILEGNHRHHAGYEADVSGHYDRVLRIIAEYKGTTVEDLPAQLKNCANIGLFCSPETHRRLFRFVYDREKEADSGKSATEYREASA